MGSDKRTEGNSLNSNPVFTRGCYAPQHPWEAVVLKVYFVSYTNAASRHEISNLLFFVFKGKDNCIKIP